MFVILGQQCNSDKTLIHQEYFFTIYKRKMKLFKLKISQILSLSVVQIMFFYTE